MQRARFSFCLPCVPVRHARPHPREPTIVHRAEAYQILSDPSQRTKYNAKLEEALKDEEDDYTGKQPCLLRTAVVHQKERSQGSAGYICAGQPRGRVAGGWPGTGLLVQAHKCLNLEGWGGVGLSKGARRP